MNKKNAFDNVACKMAAIFSQPQCVKSRFCYPSYIRSEAYDCCFFFCLFVFNQNSASNMKQSWINNELICYWQDVYINLKLYLTHSCNFFVSLTNTNWCTCIFFCFVYPIINLIWLGANFCCQRYKLSNCWWFSCQGHLIVANQDVIELLNFFSILQ